MAHRDLKGFQKRTEKQEQTNLLLAIQQGADRRHIEFARWK